MNVRWVFFKKGLTTFSPYTRTLCLNTQHLLFSQQAQFCLCILDTTALFFCYFFRVLSLRVYPRGQSHNLGTCCIHKRFYLFSCVFLLQTLQHILYTEQRTHLDLLFALKIYILDIRYTQKTPQTFQFSLKFPFHTLDIFHLCVLVVAVLLLRLLVW